MTPEPCPTCKGRCCRDHYGYRIAHMDTDAEFCEHTCDACKDGYAPTPIASLTPAADTERAAVLAYLRSAYAPNTIVPLPDFLAALLRMVEKGEHHREGNE